MEGEAIWGGTVERVEREEIGVSGLRGKGVGGGKKGRGSWRREDKGGGERGERGGGKDWRVS